LKATVAEGAGFCFGVKRALNIAFEAARGENGPVFTLGPIIHNPQVVAKLEDEGVRVIENLDEVEDGTLIVRSHGLPRRVLEDASGRNLDIVDATCPFVKEAQERAAQLEKEGHAVVVVGEEDHPEVLSITGSLDGPATVVDGTAGIPALPDSRSVGVVCQTTQPQEHLAAVTLELLKRFREVKVFNTICDATFDRQKSALELARGVDVMLVVGGRNSANTRRLYELCRGTGCDAYHIETADELKPSWFGGKSEVGITGGASTPQWIIDDVVAAVERI
jgi:(E)-4-hydroxy-3-methyl-but-2-enyl pyrophosphate reductase